MFRNRVARANARAAILIVPIAVSAGIGLAGCHKEAPTVVPNLARGGVSAMATPAEPAVPSASPIAPTAAAATITPTVASRRPTDEGQVVFQVGRVEPSPWEPAILAQMAPRFTLQADGYAVFAHAGGPSIDGLYQAGIPPWGVDAFLARLVDDIDIAGLAAARPETELSYRSRADGTPIGAGTVVMVYVWTPDGEIRLVCPATELAQPIGPDALRMEELAKTLGALDTWMAGVEESVAEGDRASATRLLGWWADAAEPYTPDAIVAIGSRAPASAPSDAQAASWPLDQPMSDLFDVAFGRQPSEVTLTGADAAAVWRAGLERPSSFWGPLWQETDSDARYLVGLRIAPPGSNHLLLSYRYTSPPTDLAAPTATPGL